MHQMLTDIKDYFTNPERRPTKFAPLIKFQELGDLVTDFGMPGLDPAPEFTANGKGSATGQSNASSVGGKGGKFGPGKGKGKGGKKGNGKFRRFTDAHWGKGLAKEQACHWAEPARAERVLVVGWFVILLGLFSKLGGAIVAHTSFAAGGARGGRIDQGGARDGGGPGSKPRHLRP